MDYTEWEATRGPVTQGMRAARFAAIALISLMCGLATFQLGADAKVADLTVNRCAVMALSGSSPFWFLSIGAAALVIAAVGFIGGAVARSGWFVLAALVLAGAIVVGFVTGQWLTNPTPCDAGQASIAAFLVTWAI